MKMMKRMLALMMVLAVCCALTACKKEEPAAPVQTNLSDASAAKPDECAERRGN